MFGYYLRLSWLSLKKTPFISSLMVLAIAVGIGLTMTMLTVFYLMSANPMGEKSEQLFSLQFQTKGVTNSDDIPWQMTYQDAMAMYRSDIPTLHTPMFKTGFSIQTENRDIKPFFTEVRVSTKDIFAMFEMEFLYGDVWSKSADETATMVTVIDESINQRVFGGGDNVGKTILFDSQVYTVVGIIKPFNPSPKFYDLNNGEFDSGEQIFIPWALTTALELRSWGNNNGWKAENITTFSQRLSSEEMWMQYWVQLDTPEQKSQFADFMAAHVAEQKQLGRFSRDDARGYLRNVTQWLDYHEVISEDNRLLVGLSFMFLVVCLVNTIGLLLAKFLRRASEVGVRRALGASQFQVFLQHLTEVSLVGFLGGVLGIVLALIGLEGVRVLFSGYDALVQMDMTLMALAVALALVSSVLAGVYPAYRICRTSPAVHLKTQ